MQNYQSVTNDGYSEVFETMEPVTWKPGEPEETRIYTLDDAELANAPVTAEGQKIRTELEGDEQLRCCAEGCRCQCICRSYGAYGEGSSTDCLAADLDHYWQRAEECKAVACDEAQLLANLEALRNSIWIASCPGELGEVILNRAIAVTRDRQRRAQNTADFEQDMYWYLMQSYAADPDSELWQKLFRQPCGVTA
jgi:hypothetical protein